MGEQLSTTFRPQWGTLRLKGSTLIQQYNPLPQFNVTTRAKIKGWTILSLCLTICKTFSECKIFSVENILCKRKHFLLFDYVMEITPENYFLCLLLDVKKYIFKKCKHKPATTTKEKDNPPPPTQNPNREKGKSRHHFSVAITTHKKSTITHTKPTNTPPPTPHKTHQKHHHPHNNNKIID